MPHVVSRISQAERIMLLVFHHISVDLWSMVLLLTDLQRLYGRALRQREARSQAQTHAETEEPTKADKTGEVTLEEAPHMQYWEEVGIQQARLRGVQGEKV